MSSQPAISQAELQEVAERIKSLHKKATEHAVEIGHELLRIKAALPHGAFVKWVEKKCEFKIRMAQNFMTLARAVEANAEIAAVLVPSTLRVYLSKNTPSAVRQLVKNRLENGERVSRHELHLAIAEAKMLKRVEEDHPAAAIANLRGDAKPDLLAAGEGGKDSEIDRSKKIADLLMQRLSTKDHEYIMHGMNWGIWNRVLVWLSMRHRAPAEPANAVRRSKASAPPTATAA